MVNIPKEKKIHNRWKYNFCVGKLRFNEISLEKVFLACDEITKRHFNARIYATQ